MSESPEAPTQPELDRAVLKRRARLGIVWLIVRTAVLQVAVLGGTVVLARLLDPADFGLFGVAQFAISFFLFFGDAGLGGALIQKKERPSELELSSIFFLQLGIAVAVLVVVGFGAPGVRLIWKDLPEGAEWVFRALSVGLVLTVLRVIPQILMERELLFGRLAAIEVVSQIGFYGGAATCAWMRLGVWSLVVGTLLQGTISTLLAYALRPWRPGLMFDRQVLVPLLRFGIPFQLKTVIAFFNGAITPVYAGAVLGARALGFIQWAQQVAYFPLKLIAIMGRVTFPLYSRLKDDPEVFAETLGRSLQICAFGTFFFVALFLGMGDALVHVVFTDKWMPALPLMHIYACAITIGFISPVAAAALDASGRPQIIAKLSLFWTALNWIVVVFATPRYGITGFVAGYAVHIVVGNIAVLVMMLRVIPGVRTARRMAASMVAGGVVFAFTRYASPYAQEPLRFVGAAVAAFLVYAAVVLVLDLRGVRDAIALIPQKKGGAPDEEAAA